jgi:carbamoyl-phosphate synthase large subunit
MKLLITSVGSLVGQGILDVLEYPGHSRRSLVTVVGTNSLADAPNNFRCDRCYLVPQTADASFAARIREILIAESPDLILCGRDEDTLALSRLKAEDPKLPGVLPIGKPGAALIGLDKWQTWLFSRKHGLPMAETFMPRVSGDETALEDFCRKFGYPLIAKPARGFASIGVQFVRDVDDLREVLQREGYLLQEYLGDPRPLQAYFAVFRGLPPLFAHAPNADQYSCMAVVSPVAEVGPLLCTWHRMDYGVSTRYERMSDPSLEQVADAYMHALAAEGVTGPVNMNLRRDRHGAYKVVEINLRNTGATYPRFLMGLDELFLIARAFVPHVDFPASAIAETAQPDRIIRAYSAHPVNDAQVTTLTRAGVWSRFAK